MIILLLLFFLKLQKQLNLFLSRGDHFKSFFFNNNRLCIVCSVEAIEDEFQFLLHCIYFSKLRTEIYTNFGFNNKLLIMSDLVWTSFIFSDFPRQTAKFHYSALMCKQSILYRFNRPGVYSFNFFKWKIVMSLLLFMKHIKV